MINMWGHTYVIWYSVASESLEVFSAASEGTEAVLLFSKWMMLVTEKF